MKATKALWRVSVLTSGEAEDAAAEILRELLGGEPVAYFDCETRLSTLSLYLANPKVWTAPLRTKLRRRLAGLSSFGLNPGPGRLRFEKVRKEDWAESWKRHFKPLPIGSTLLVRPSWVRPAKAFQCEVVLDPGLSFGTGQHPTTEFCLRQLASPRLIRNGGGLLDIGTGTGILAIAAAKLGYQPIEAFDFDPEAVAVARANARKNGVAKRLALYQQDLTRLPRKAKARYEIVCANLTANLLVSELDRILARLKPGGSLILAGILAEEFEVVRRACVKAGLRLVKDRVHKEWRSGWFIADA